MFPRPLHDSGIPEQRVPFRQFFAVLHLSPPKNVSRTKDSPSLGRLHRCARRAERDRRSVPAPIPPPSSTRPSRVSEPMPAYMCARSSPKAVRLNVPVCIQSANYDIPSQSQAWGKVRIPTVMCGAWEMLRRASAKGFPHRHVCLVLRRWAASALPAPVLLRLVRFLCLAPQRHPRPCPTPSCMCSIAECGLAARPASCALPGS